MPITMCDSSERVRAEIEIVRKKVSLDETEDTWDIITQGILHLTRLCKDGGCEFPSEMVAGIRSVSRPLSSALNSERSRLSGAVVELLMVLATGLGPLFDPLVPQFVPTILALCGRTNKVFTSRAKACILAIVQHTRLPSLLPYFAELANHKSVFPRLTAAEGILACLNCFNPPDLEKETRARVVEDFIKLTARDASADVRRASKEVFKAYKTLMPARVDSFIAPLTPVVKKYLDIQTGPSGFHGTSSTVGRKQTSRPSSRANRVTEAGQRPASSTLSKPFTRPVPNDPPYSTRQRPADHGPPNVADIRVSRQRTTSQVLRDPPQPRNLHVSGQPSNSAQRCIVQTTAPARRAVQHPSSGAARVLPAPGATSAGGPQRPSSVQIKFNPPPDRLKVTGNGAKRIPLPSVPLNEHTKDTKEQMAADSGGVAGNTVDKPQSRLPGRSTEKMGSGKLIVGRKAFEGTRSVSSSAKSVNRSAPMSVAAVQHSHRPPTKGETSSLSGTADQRRPTTNAQKASRPPVKAERKVISPTLIPLPPSPSIPPTEIPLPLSPGCAPRTTNPEVQDEPVVATLSGSTESVGMQLGSAESCQEQTSMGFPDTPITTLLSSIQRGFLFTPSSPLSPPQNYLPVRGNLPENTIIVNNFAKGPLGPFCTSLEDDSIVNGLDRYALKDLN